MNTYTEVIGTQVLNVVKQRFKMEKERKVETCGVKCDVKETW